MLGVVSYVSAGVLLLKSPSGIHKTSLKLGMSNSHEIALSIEFK